MLAPKTGSGNLVVDNCELAFVTNLALLVILADLITSERWNTTKYLYLRRVLVFRFLFVVRFQVLIGFHFQVIFGFSPEYHVDHFLDFLSVTSLGKFVQLLGLFLLVIF